MRGSRWRRWTGRGAKYPVASRPGSSPEARTAAPRALTRRSAAAEDLLAVGVADRIGRSGERAQGQRFLRRALDPYPPILELEVVGRDLEQARGQPENLVPHLRSCRMDGVPARHESPARERSRSPVELAGVARDDCHLTRVATQGAGRDLGEGGVVALTLCGETGGYEDSSARLHTDVRALVGADAGALDIAGQAEPEMTALAAGLGLMRAKGWERRSCRGPSRVLPGSPRCHTGSDCRPGT